MDTEPDAPDAARPARWIALAIALAFLGGAAGYLVGVRTSEPDAAAETDTGFIADMTDHHDQAVEMALLALDRAEDPVVRSFAEEVLLFQRYELGRFRSIEERWGVQRPEYDPERLTMAWMGMPTPLSSMPGMASEEDLARLAAAEGSAFDLLFLELMAEHHRGGLHMSDVAATQAKDAEVRELAALMARNQRQEVAEYEALIERLRSGS